MRIQPLTGMLRPAQIFLAPDGAGGAGGGSNGNSGTGNQDDDVIPDDLKIDFGLDPDLLPTAEREKFEAAQVKLQALQKRLMKAGSNDAALQQLQQEIQQLRRGQEPPPKREDEPESIQDTMRAHYKSIGVAPDQIEGLLKLNAPILENLAQRLVGHMGAVAAPISERAMMGELKDVFYDLQDSDPRYQIPEVAQQVWEKSESMIKKGIDVNLDVMRNLARIAYMEVADRNPEAIVNTSLPSGQRRQQDITRMPQNNNTSRLTYPGAGSHVAAPAARQQTIDIDPATQAALGHVKGAWNGYLQKPKDTFGKPVPRR